MEEYIKTHSLYEELDVPQVSGYTVRLLLPELKYARPSLEWVSDKDVGQFMGADFSDVSLAGEEKRLVDILHDKDSYNWIIEVDGKAVGNININEIEVTTKEFGVKAGNLNYLLGDKTLWGKGLTTAIAKKVLNWAFNKGGFEVIKSRAIPQNVASLAVLKKLGFEEYKKEEYDGPDIGEPTEYIAHKLYKPDSNS